MHSSYSKLYPKFQPQVTCDHSTNCSSRKIDAWCKALKFKVRGHDTTRGELADEWVQHSSGAIVYCSKRSATSLRSEIALTYSVHVWRQNGRSYLPLGVARLFKCALFFSVSVWAFFCAVNIDVHFVQIFSSDASVIWIHNLARGKSRFLFLSFSFYIVKNGETTFLVRLKWSLSFSSVWMCLAFFASSSHRKSRRRSLFLIKIYCE